MGSETGEAQIQVSQQSTYRSLRVPTSALCELRADATTVSTESVPVRRLDDFLADLRIPSQRIWLKVDTQGFEIPVLEGASWIWDRIAVAQVEMATRPSYEGQPGLEDVIGFMRERGFYLADMIPGFADDGLLLELDGIFLAEHNQHGSPS